jgi:predicted PurR-regulated permease PerM
MTEDSQTAVASAGRSRSNKRIAVFTVVAVAALLFIWALGDIFAPVFAALALAYMLDPLVKRLEGRGWRRKRAVLAIFSAVLFLIVVTLAASIPYVIRDVSYAVSVAKARLEQAGAIEKDDASRDDADAADTGDAGDEDGLKGKLTRALRRSETMSQALDWAEERRLTDRAFVWLQENARLVAEQTLSAARGGMAILYRLGWLGLMVLLFPVYLYFFMVGLGKFTSKVFALVPPALRPRVESMAREFGVALSGFFRGRLVVALSIGAFTSILFVLVGLRFGVFLGMAIGMASLVPFVNIVFLLPALIIAPVQFESFWMVAAIFGIYALGQALDPLLTPYLMSKGTGLHPVTIIVSLLVWGRLLGVVGLLLAVPLTAAVKIASREILLPALAGDGPAEADPASADSEDSA